MATAAARGLVIPDDLSIIGYDDIPVVSRLPVPLTTIREPFNNIARGAIDLLLQGLGPVVPVITGRSVVTALVALTALVTVVPAR